MYIPKLLIYSFDNTYFANQNTKFLAVLNFLLLACLKGEASCKDRSRTRLPPKVHT